ncbi:hypothetical protein VTI74DRAFT_11149 [Chaetomium olivicolor]
MCQTLPCKLISSRCQELALCIGKTESHRKWNSFCEDGIVPIFFPNSSTQTNRCSFNALQGNTVSLELTIFSTVNITSASSSKNTMTQHQMHFDPELFDLCVQAFHAIPSTDENHTVAAAVRSTAGKTFVALNVYHFTGGPCAELCVLGAAAAGGVLAGDIDTIVAVCRREGDIFSIINPCGRCRQTLLDYNPEIKVIMLNSDGREVEAKARELMLYAYVWEDGNTGRKEEEENALKATA